MHVWVGAGEARSGRCAAGELFSASAVVNRRIHYSSDCWVCSVLNMRGYSHSSSARAAAPAPASPLAGAHPPRASIRHGQRPGQRGSGWASLLVRGNRLLSRSPPPSTGSRTSSSHRRPRTLEMEDLLHGVRVELTRPAACFGDFGLPDAARCQASSQVKIRFFLHPFVSQEFQSEV
jgi:hypothetical protein